MEVIEYICESDELSRIPAAAAAAAAAAADAAGTAAALAPVFPPCCREAAQPGHGFRAEGRAGRAPPFVAEGARLWEG